MIFELSKKQKAQVAKWLHEEVYPEVIEEQKASGKFETVFAECDWEMGYPTAGSIGGGVSYTFTPTSLGLGLTVSAWNRTLDVTEYELW